MQKRFWGLNSKKSKLLAGATALVVAAGVFLGAIGYMDTQIKPIEAKTPADVQQVLEARKKKRTGCYNAADLVNMNIMLRAVDNPELFQAVLDGLRYENGAIVYPQTAEQPHELAIVKKFFEQVNIVNMQDFEQCIMCIKNAREHYLSRQVMSIRQSLFG